MKDYIHLGSQALEFPGQCRVEPSVKGTPFSAKLDADMERRLIAAGQIKVAPAVGEEASNARKGGR